ncbi:MAG: GIY-YIG nuclease family protein [Chitinophagales bacterium]|nr:GIY-YIG nuclease family protein [Chitinophagales bacterium]HMV16003.1 GIY-YIG nuclease family protein [Chitinophagales bacterium]HMW11993.1 GIY-YIG nuclease family protein [Chitinophagales bacterium]HMX59671.1 GIY-YIG nuclease family protein [Chitinophagales bacterium]HMY22703.1 GIY-YIG nuclease family protein [Chitinophagales bacterium]
MKINKKEPCIYIISNTFGNVIYIGVTSDLWNRILQHKQGDGSVFTKKYKINKLIYFEEFTNMMEAIEREKQLKKWNRKWKDELIDTMNIERIDLAKDWYSEKDIIEYNQSRKYFI